MRYGAAYYPEYQPYDRLERDIALMREANLTFVRLGESTWSNWEPADGRFEFGWMEKVVDALHEAGIEVLLGTPTYAIPPWLHRKYPEIMAVRARGERVWYGGRQNVDLTHAAYRFHAERVIRAVVGHFAGHPAVIGYQVDNETGVELPHNRTVVEHFRDWLRTTYGSVDVLNELWGLTYWSQRLGSWEDLWTPDGNTNPGYALAWRRFQARTVADFLAWQAAIVREHARPGQFVTHCLAGGHGAPAVDRHDIAQALDVVGENPYYAMQDALALPPAPGSLLGAPEWTGADESGPWSLLFQADLGRSARRSGFLVTETNALSIGGSHTNYPAYDGQWRLAAYSLISRGAEAVEYWHWHTLHYGHEMYWGGILGHDLEPNRCYREISRIGAELRELDETLTGLEPDEDVGLLYSTENKWALEFQPPLPVPGSRLGDRGSYQRIVNAFYRALVDARDRVRRRARACPVGARARAAARGHRSELPGVLQLDGAAPAARGGRRNPGRAGRCRRRGMGGRPRAGGRRGPRPLRAPALRPVPCHLHQPVRLRPAHLCRHAAQRPAGPGAGGVGRGGFGPGALLGGPARGGASERHAYAGG